MTAPLAAPSRRPQPLTDWLAAACVAAMWLVIAAGWLLDVQSFAWFMVTMAVDVAMTLLFLAWWFTRRSFPLSRRAVVAAGALLFGVAVELLSRHAIAVPPFLVLAGVPILLAVWWAGFMLTRRMEAGTRTGVLLACVAAAWCPFLLVRLSGYRGNLQADLHWRWTPTAEQLYLAQRPAAAPTGQALLPVGRTLELQPGDWPAFRGPGRDGVARGVRVGLDWAQSPPKVLWRQRVGPAWSSMVIVDGYLFTQEQRGDREAVVCRDATSGQELWTHEDPVRFEEGMSGIGPRATPAFDKGRIYAQGTLGALHCLDAATGRVIWSRDVRQESNAPVPMWGFSDSPLVEDNRVIVFAGGEAKKSLVAYSAVDGHPLWTADTGKLSYGSPQAFDVPGGGRAILMFTNEGLFCVDPAAGRVRWTLPLEARMGLPAALQACVVGPRSIVLGNGAAFGAQRVELASDDAAPSRAWATQRVKPAFSDMVCHDGFIYGFDGTVFCCVDAATGARRWREGRFGAGQVVLLADQGALIVCTEDGQAVLLRCNPQRYEELGRIQAITGKAWNHPAIAGNRLYVRSDAEMACLQLQPPAGP